MRAGLAPSGFKSTEPKEPKCAEVILMLQAAPDTRSQPMKMKAIFTVEFEAEDGGNARESLAGALDRASKALKDSIEQGTSPGANTKTGILQNSTNIIVTSQIE